jgi:hypothetical protein
MPSVEPPDKPSGGFLLVGLMQGRSRGLCQVTQMAGDTNCEPESN